MPSDPDAIFLAALRSDGARLAEAARLAGWGASVPGLDWTVRDLVVHTGAVHRWSADVVRRRLGSNETGGSAAFHPGRPDAELLGWYAEGLAALVDVLTGAPADLAAWTLVPGAEPRRFWCRRQAHETAVHRADAEAAAGLDVTDFEPAFAQDGLDELLVSFARGRRFATAQPGRLALRADDGDDWLVDFGGERIVADRRDAAGSGSGADATVTGSSSDLYRWAWNRPSPATVAGDPAVVALWRRVRIT